MQPPCTRPLCAIAALVLAIALACCALPSAAFKVAAPADFVFAHRILMMPRLSHKRLRAKTPTVTKASGKPAARATDKAAAEPASKAVASASAPAVPAAGALPAKELRFQAHWSVVDLRVKPLLRQDQEAAVLEALEDYRRSARRSCQISAFGPWKDHLLRVRYKTKITPQAITKFCKQLRKYGASRDLRWAPFLKPWVRGLAGDFF